MLLSYQLVYFKLLEQLSIAHMFGPVDRFASESYDTYSAAGSIITCYQACIFVKEKNVRSSISTEPTKVAVGGTCSECWLIYNLEKSIKKCFGVTRH